MNVLMFAAEYVGDNGGILIGSLLMALLIVAGVAVIAVAAVLYVKRGAKEALLAVGKTDEKATDVSENSVHEADETEPEALPEEPTVSMAELAATVDKTEVPEFIESILVNLGDESKDVFSYRVIGRNYGAMNTMKDVRDYESEQAFATEFFKNANRFYRPFNAEIFTELYDRLKPSLSGDELSRLNVAYANALYYYRKDDPALVGKAIMMLKDDAEYHLAKDNTYFTKVPSLKKLILIYSARGDYREAIEYCDKAIAHKIYDVRQSGFEPRRRELIEKRDRAEARAARAAVKTAANE